MEDVYVTDYMGEVHHSKVSHYVIISDSDMVPTLFIIYNIIITARVQVPKINVQINHR